MYDSWILFESGEVTPPLVERLIFIHFWCRIEFPVLTGKVLAFGHYNCVFCTKIMYTVMLIANFCIVKYSFKTVCLSLENVFSDSRESGKIVKRC